MSGFRTVLVLLMLLAAPAGSQSGPTLAAADMRPATSLDGACRSPPIATFLAGLSP